MRRSGPFVDDYLNSKGNRLKADIPFEWEKHEPFFSGTLEELKEYRIRTIIERTRVRLDNCADQSHRSLLENHLKLANARLLAHKLAE